MLTGRSRGHLPPPEGEVFLARARRTAPELAVPSSAPRHGVEPEEHPEQVLDDGTRHAVLERYLTAGGPAEELGGGVLVDGARSVGARGGEGGRQASATPEPRGARRTATSTHPTASTSQNATMR